MAGIKKYVELSLTELQNIDPSKAICLIAVSPIEVHGPHLPLGTDVFIAEKLQGEYCKELTERLPDYDLLILPPIYAGCDPVPVKGSIGTGARTLEKLMGDYVRGLAGQGFRYLIVCDNHGGPSHQMALEIIARRAWRRYRFAVINPFNVVFRKMVQHDRSFLELTGLRAGECGDDADCHAGTNETSLMLATNPDLIKGYMETPACHLPERTGAAAAVGKIGNLFGRLGFKRLQADFDHLANLLAWVGSKDVSTYLGSPGSATPEAGERMIKGHVAVTMALVDRALSGIRPDTDPMLWWMRALRK